MENSKSYFNPEIETMYRGELDALIEERVRYTVKYAAENSPFYRKWFEKHRVNPGDIKAHEDLLELPIISGKTIRENQPPERKDFMFRSVGWEDVFTIHETSGTSGTPKSFFLTWEDWERYAEKYARIFRSQGFGPGDRVVVCASYGMNVGANTMTLAARQLGMSIIPEGKCTFPLRVIEAYRPTGIVGSVFKLLNLARRMQAEGIDPEQSGVNKLVVGGEAFAEESRNHLSEIWGCPVYNTYGSTEGTMCGECSEITGLHVPEDFVHLDVYDPRLENFVPDGDCGRVILSTLLPVGAKAGNLLLNYDTDDTTVVLTRKTCSCGRTHMKILTPQREAETSWVEGTPFNRVDVERGVFQSGNMDYLTGEYEAFLYGGEDEGENALRVSLECENPETCDRTIVKENFLHSFFRYKPPLARAYEDGTFKILFNFTGPGELELYKIKGRPKRLVDRR
ncbi:TPA: coenzyme F390 synthetase [Methanosarcina acetivorans]|uniref:Coenzyme F390 synthetase n=1 Tax=Methanosarcina acetivorans TaxID=2214 RepID=A0A832SD11_9EURY|nr:coenzyme F390 synthetase [Methanosarcina acetivorans]HIH94709.1 coenzyme F390 synthetase [Methanosarcina acetivorans]